MAWTKWWLGARPRTLPAAVAPVLVGTAAAVGAGGAATGLSSVVWWRFGCALAVALLVQIGTNFANDYSDGKRGTDDPGARMGPVRLVGSGLASPRAVKRAAIICFAATLVAGTPLVLFVDWRLGLVGVAAVAAGWFYTGGPRPYGYAGLGELFVFVFFGLVATLGSTYVQTESLADTASPGQLFPAVSWVAAVAMGCLATALLVINNLRDIPGDTASGKQTLAVRLGAGRTRILYTLLIVVPIVCVPLLVLVGASPVVALALVSVVAASLKKQRVLGGAAGAELIAVLGA
ncbi:MAG: 1,4-dihydroxy-2-naphthoate polyprenyltransferase, partial [Microthrixaceae bacterium]|nr:1,4-dihydroxy-2-naphthoate polyprenyltransferase [Microthrixaceae bacterium]